MCIKQTCDECLVDSALLALRERPKHQAARAPCQGLDGTSRRKVARRTSQQQLATGSIAIDPSLDGKKEWLTRALVLIDRCSSRKRLDEANRIFNGPLPHRFVVERESRAGCPLQQLVDKCGLTGLPGTAHDDDAKGFEEIFELLYGISRDEFLSHGDIVARITQHV